MWQLKSAPKTMKVTRKLAQRFAQMDAPPHDRPMSERRLAVYSQLFAEGRFRPCTWALAHCEETGGIYRVNGKHTSTLLANMKDLPEFFVTIEEYDCQTLDDVARLYATFDSNLQSRSAYDIYLSFAATSPQLAALPRSIICYAAGGLGYAKWQEDSGRHQPAERAELLLESPELVLWLDSILSSERNEGRDLRERIARHLMRRAVVAAMCATWDKNKADAERFWQAVRDETGAEPSLPDRKLARYLLTVGVNNGGGTKKIRVANDREIFVKCLKGWNAWRKDEPTDLRYYADADIPKVA